MLSLVLFMALMTALCTHIDDFESNRNYKELYLECEEITEIPYYVSFIFLMCSSNI